jgi:FtsP/CotA-like multicopper oxidase with cupredoxin domain
VAVTANSGTVGNGKKNEAIDIDAGQWYRLRVSIVAAFAEPQNLVFGNATSCSVHKVASDGIWRSSVPGSDGKEFELTGASRADFAIRCLTENSLVPILYGDALAATIRVGSLEPKAFVMVNWAPERPDFLPDLRLLDAKPENTFSVTLGFDYVNDLRWDPATPMSTIAFNEVHEWTLHQTSRHPFHIHLYHMQISTPGGCGAHEEGEYYDTISAPENCTVRFLTADIGQRCVLHCHVLQHEDAGSMSWVEVTGENMPRNDAESLEYTCAAVVSPTSQQPPGPPSSPTPSSGSVSPTASPTPSSGSVEANWLSIFLAAALGVQYMFL